MSAREGIVIEGELVDSVNAPLLKRALALPEARTVALPTYFDKLLKAIDECETLDQARECKDHAEEAAICARRLKDGHLIEKARKITAYTLRMMGEHLNKLPEGQRGKRASNVVTIRTNGGGHRGPVDTKPTTRMEAAKSAGITASAARRASSIARIDKDTFTTVVEQPGSCSTRTLEQIAREQQGARGGSSGQQRAAGLRRHAEAKIRDFANFIGMHEPKTIAKLFGSDRSSIKKTATTSRDWLTSLLRALE